MTSQKIMDLLESDHGLPEFYSNGATVTTGAGDMTLIFKRNENPTFLVTVTYNTAISLAKVIQGLVQTLETKTGGKVLTNQELITLLEDEE